MSVKFEALRKVQNDHSINVKNGEEMILKK